MAINSSKEQGQVQLSKLIFTHNWEDPAIDEKALAIKKGDVVFTVTSGGCNTLCFLRLNPSEIYCVDINAAQNHLMELKKAAFEELDHSTMACFFGLKKIGIRNAIFRSLKKNLSSEAIDFWELNNRIIEKGIIMNGRYERFIKVAGVFIRFLQGRKKVNELFKLQSVEEQKAFYDEKWDNKRWRWIFNIAFNKKRLAKKGLVSNYFHFDDGSSSFSESFYKRASHMMKNIPIKSNYFAALYYLGHYLDDQAIPEYLKPENFGLIKQNIHKVTPVTADCKYWLEKQPDNMFDAFALSNICELMDENDTLKLFKEVLRTAKQGARIIFRNLMIPREVPESLRTQIVKNEELSIALQKSDRSFVYGKVAAYSICK
jgi:S-adenosylmethionine-diacylglycerol 3-amino-3-carboxypropyl transferase